MLLFFAYLIAGRNILLAFVEDIEYRRLLGETEQARPQQQLLMVYTFLSINLALNMKNFLRAIKTKFKLNWLEPFSVLRGEVPPSNYDLSQSMMLSWYHYTTRTFHKYSLLTFVSLSTSSIFFLYLIRHRWSTYGAEQDLMFYNGVLVFWSSMNILWSILAFTHMLVCFVYFTSLCYYFTIRYEKVSWFTCFLPVINL